MKETFPPERLNRNTSWCRLLVEELAELGIADAVICPGARSAAMVAALRDSGRLRLYVQADERSAAFFALGIILRTRRPAAICVTSGSAVANLLPALTEAYAANLPLVILSCDRPKHLRNAGYPQTTAQVDFCAPVVMASLDLRDPVEDADVAVGIATAIGALDLYLKPGPFQGPVQINIPLWGKLSSVDREPPASGDEAGVEKTSFLSKSPTQMKTSPWEIAKLANTLMLRPGMKGLIVYGANCSISDELVRCFAEISAFPLLADAPGTLRAQPLPSLITEADLLAASPQTARHLPELIVRFGSAPVSSDLQHFLKTASKAPTLRIANASVERDFLCDTFFEVIAPDEATIEQLAEPLAPGDADWRRLWTESARRCRNRLRELSATAEWSELRVVAEVAKAGGFDFVHAANSLAIRLVNLLLGKGLAVYANRGVNGIDGTLGTFLGELAASDGAGLLLIADLAAIHDLPALEAALHLPLKGTILVLNNQGGALFDSLPLRNLPDYTQLYRNPAAVNFAHVAAAFGLGYARCIDAQQLSEALRQPRAGLQLIEAVIPSSASVRQGLKLARLAKDPSLFITPRTSSPIHKVDQAVKTGGILS